MSAFLRSAARGRKGRQPASYERLGNYRFVVYITFLFLHDVDDPTRSAIGHCLKEPEHEFCERCG